MHVEFSCMQAWCVYSVACHRQYSCMCTGTRKILPGQNQIYWLVPHALEYRYMH